MTTYLPDMVSHLSGGITAAMWFALAIVLMDRFDISLPRGDSIGVSGALIAAGMIVADPVYVALFSLAALVVAHLGPHKFNAPRLIGGFISRGCAIAWVFLVSWVIPPQAGLTLFAGIRAVSLSVTYLLVEMMVNQLVMAVRSGRPLHRLLLGNIYRQAPLVAAQASAAVLAAITYPQMGAWSLVLVVALLLLIRQSLALLLEIRETYRATVEVLVEAAEGEDQRLRGHGERSAKIARDIGSRIGLNPAMLEKVSYATLLHDLDALSGASNEHGPDTGSSAQVFENSAFFEDVLPVLMLCDGCTEIDNVSDQDLMIAMIVAISSDIDANSHPQVAAAHSESALSRLAAKVPPQIKARVVSAALELGYPTPAVD